MKLSPGDHTARANDVQLSYTVRGEGPLLFVTSPGWGIASAYLQRGLAPLEKQFKLIFIDTRGSGKSARPTDATQMGSTVMADDIDGLRRYLELDSIDLLGHSNGGTIAIAYAERHGASLRRLVLVSSQLLGFERGDVIRKFLDDAADDPRYRAAVPYHDAPVPKTDAAFRQWFGNLLPLYFHDPRKNQAAFEAAIGNPPSAWAFHAQKAADQLPSADLVPRLGDIQATTLILVGRHCWICPVAVSEKLHAEIRNSSLVIFEQTGHFPWIEEPERFFPEVTRFLAA